MPTERPAILGEPVLLPDPSLGQWNGLEANNRAQNALTERTLILRLEAAGLLTHTEYPPQTHPAVQIRWWHSEHPREGCNACALVAWAKEGGAE